MAILVASASAHSATIAAKIHNIVSSTTQDYVFNEAGVGRITLRAVYTPTLNGSPAGGASFTSLGSGLRVGSNADTAASGSGNHFRNYASNIEGFTVSISLLSADAWIDTSTIAFSFDQLGMRADVVNPDQDFTWQSSSTELSTTNATGQQLQTLDTSAYTNIANVDYLGTWSMPTVDDYIQLSDEVTGGNGVVMTATFVPEPSSAALFGLGCIALMLRRRR